MAVVAPIFSVVVPTYNRADLLRSALETVAGLAVPEGWRGEVLVVDNNSPDHTASVVDNLRNRFPLPLRSVVETRQGLNHARNRGMHEGRGDWLIYLDDDIKIAPDWLLGFAEAVRLFDPDVVTGPVLPWFEAEVPAWCTGRVLDSVTSSYSRRGDQPFVLAGRETGELPGCNFAVRRALALELGGFHPALDRAGDGMLAGGDFEFGMRLADRRARTVYIPGCRIQHLVSQRKMSKAGLKERWRGLGVTAKAIQSIRADSITWRRRCRLVARLHRLRWRARRLAAVSPDAAFVCELEALRLHGMLFGRIGPLTRGRWG